MKLVIFNELQMQATFRKFSKKILLVKITITKIHYSDTFFGFLKSF